LNLTVVAVVLGLGLGVAIDPPAVAFIIRLLGGRDGVRKSWACVGGSVAAVTLVAVMAFALVRLFGNVVINPAHAGTGGGDTVALLEGLLGIALVIQAVFAFIRGAEGTNALVERALSDVDAVRPSVAFALGVTLVSLTMPVVVGAVLTQVRSPFAVLVQLGLLLAFLAIATSTRVAPVLVESRRPGSAAASLSAVRARIERYGGPVGATVTLALGIVFIAVGVMALVS
jgi:ABC-type multidrug transport system fused ATPase/permease subunit